MALSPRGRPPPLPALPPPDPQLLSDSLSPSIPQLCQVQTPDLLSSSLSEGTPDPGVVGGGGSVRFPNNEAKEGAAAPPLPPADITRVRELLSETQSLAASLSVSPEINVATFLRHLDDLTANIGVLRTAFCAYRQVPQPPPVTRRPTANGGPLLPSALPLRSTPVPPGLGLPSAGGPGSLIIGPSAPRPAFTRTPSATSVGTSAPLLPRVSTPTRGIERVARAASVDIRGSGGDDDFKVEKFVTGSLPLNLQERPVICSAPCQAFAADPSKSGYLYIFADVGIYATNRRGKGGKWLVEMIFPLYRTSVEDPGVLVEKDSGKQCHALQLQYQSEQLLVYFSEMTVKQAFVPRLVGALTAQRTWWSSPAAPETVMVRVILPESKALAQLNIGLSNTHKTLNASPFATASELRHLVIEKMCRAMTTPQIDIITREVVDYLFRHVDDQGTERVLWADDYPLQLLHIWHRFELHFKPYPDRQLQHRAEVSIDVGQPEVSEAPLEAKGMIRIQLPDNIFLRQFGLNSTFKTFVITSQHTVKQVETMLIDKLTKGMTPEQKESCTHHFRQYRLFGDSPPSSSVWMFPTQLLLNAYKRNVAKDPDWILRFKAIAPTVNEQPARSRSNESSLSQTSSQNGFGEFLRFQSRKPKKLNISEPQRVQRKLYMDEEFNWHGENPAESFELQEKLGQGAYGVVYRAVHKSSQMPIAIKELFCDPEQQTQIEAEINILKKCRHPDIVGYFGCFKRSSDIWILMDLCEMGSLADLMRILPSKSLSEVQIIGVLGHILSGLHYLHSQTPAIIHRDMKAANILLSKAGEPKLADFGISTLAVQSKVHSVIGTPCFMSPETIEGREYTCKADIWSLGIMVIELAEGRPPRYNRGTAVQIMQEIVAGPPPTLQKSSSWSKNLLDFISVCLQKDPCSRPDASQLLEHPLLKSAPPDEVYHGIQNLIANFERKGSSPSTSSSEVAVVAQPSVQELLTEANAFRQATEKVVAKVERNLITMLKEQSPLATMQTLERPLVLNTSDRLVEQEVATQTVVLSKDPFLEDTEYLSGLNTMERIVPLAASSVYLEEELETISPGQYLEEEECL